MKENTLVIIIDFDNFFRKTIFDYNEKEFEYELKQLVDDVLINQNVNDLDYILIRLYSGWYQNEKLTKKASVLFQKIAIVDIFPIKISNKLINGKINVATSLHLLPDYTWTDTYHEKNGLSRIRINRELISEKCNENKQNCPIFILHNFTKKKTKFCSVEGCSYRQNDVFSSMVQKMVDTIIACDYIAFCDNENVNSIFLISDDVDHIPALVQGSIKINERKKLFVGIRNQLKLDYYQNILNNFNINTILLS
ncbi:MAG: hypothetical protein PF448_09410 [Bacteroidales bacterium]|jgi:hypothetical protein|nr:hypothetical protein [Bacteroidales bacterium]